MPLATGYISRAFTGRQQAGFTSFCTSLLVACMLIVSGTVMAATVAPPTKVKTPFSLKKEVTDSKLIKKSKIKDVVDRVHLDPATVALVKEKIGAGPTQSVVDYLNGEDPELGDLRSFVFIQYFNDYYNEHKGSTDDGKEKVDKKLRKAAIRQAILDSNAFLDRTLKSFVGIYESVDKAMSQPTNTDSSLNESLKIVQRLARFSDFQTLPLPTSSMADPNWDLWQKVGFYDLGDRYDRLSVFTDQHGDMPTFLKALIAKGYINSQTGLPIKQTKSVALIGLGDYIDGKKFSAEIVKFVEDYKDKFEAANIHIVNLRGNHEAEASNGRDKFLSPEDTADYAKMFNVAPKDFHLHYAADFTDSSSIIGRFLNSLRNFAKIGPMAFVHGGVDVWAHSSCNGNTPDRINYTALQWVLFFQGKLTTPPPMNTAWVLGIKSFAKDANGKWVVKFSHDVGPLMTRAFGNDYTKQTVMVDGVKQNHYKLKQVDDVFSESSDNFPGLTVEGMRYVLNDAGGLNARFLSVGHNPNDSDAPEPGDHSRYGVEHQAPDDRQLPIVAVHDSGNSYGGNPNMEDYEKGPDGKLRLVNTYVTGANERYSFAKVQKIPTELFNEGQIPKYLTTLGLVRQRIGTYEDFGENFDVNSGEKKFGAAPDSTRKTQTVQKPVVCKDILAN